MKTFKDDLNVAVLTTKFVIREGEAVRNVFHHSDDGMWEFTGATQGIEDTDYLVVGLGNMIELDNTLLQISDLPLGGKAHRSGINEPWRIGTMDRE